MRDETPGALYRPGLHVDAIMREYYKEQGTLRQKEKAARADALRVSEPLVAKVKKPRLPAPDCPCGKPHFAKGLCRPHYFQQRYHQDHPDSPYRMGHQPVNPSPGVSVSDSANSPRG